MGCCGSSPKEPEFDSVDAQPQPAGQESAQNNAGEVGSELKPDLDAKRKFSERKRRRVAVASENSEMVAQLRWQSAFDAMRKEEFKLPQHVLKLKETLSGHSIFGKMDSDIIDQLVKAMRVEKKNPGDTVIKEGDAGDAFYVVGDGEFACYLGDPKKGAPVATYGPGGSFGELALLYDAPRAATIKASTKGLLFKLGRMHFRNLVSNAVDKAKVGLEERLAKVPILAGLSPDQINHLAEAMETFTFHDGEYIEKMGAPADSLYVLLAGEVACHKSDGTELRLSDGAMFGESCLQDGGSHQRQANVVAVGTVRCAKLLAEDAKSILGSLQAALDHAFTRKVLSSVETFSSLSTRQMADMISRMTHTKLEVGECAVKQGETGKSFYVVRSGSVDVKIAPPGQSEAQKVATLASGQYFGERSLLTSEPANATVMAAEPTDLMGLDRQAFEEILGPLQELIERVAAEREAQNKAKTSTKYGWADLDLRQVLGEGSFGVVRIAVFKPQNQPFALKALHKGHLISTNQVKNTINEKNIMQQCDHPLILKCYATFNQTTHINLLLGIALGGELFTRMQKVGALKPKDASIYCAMVASALGFLSDRKIAHRDLKLVDFGFAKVIESRSWTFCGTPDYLAPEILAHKGHNYAVDWWALGVLTYEMMHGEPPFMEDDQMRTFKRISEVNYQIQSGLEPAAVDIIKRMLQENPSKRLGMLSGGEKDVTGHPLCAHVKMDLLLQKKLTPPYVPNLKNPMDTSNFDDFGQPSSGKKYNKYIDKKYDETWEREFGESGK